MNTTAVLLICLVSILTIAAVFLMVSQAVRIGLLPEMSLEAEDTLQAMPENEIKVIVDHSRNIVCYYRACSMSCVERR